MKKSHLLFFVFFLFLFISCGNEANKVNKTANDSAITNANKDQSNKQSMDIDTSAGVTVVDKKTPIENIFKLINLRNGTGKGSVNYDVYISDTNRIQEVNEYLSRLDMDDLQFIEINYFSDKTISKNYMKNQDSENISEKEKDRLFGYFIARYIHNHNTGYSNLSYLHRNN